MREDGKAMNWIDAHLKEIGHYQKLIEELHEDDLVEKVALLSEMLVLIGKVAAELSREHKMIYARRKQVHAEAYIKATRNKAAEAEIAVVEIRQQEAEAYGDKERWGNAFDSTKEKINALKYKIRVSVEDGSNRQGA
jgi:hypothetical protein